MVTIAGVYGVVAAHTYPQQQITETFADLVTPSGSQRALVERIHTATRVQQRHLALPLDEYARLDSFAAANDAFIRIGLELGEQAIRGALAAASLVPADVDLVLTTSVTGIAAPSLEALLAPRLGLRPDVKRIPIFGLGCVAGASGIARLNDYLLGNPDDVAVLLSVELCSLTIQRDDASMPNIVASGLFGDGAAAVVMVGAERAAGRSGPQVIASRSRLYPDTERTMGWDIGGSGFRIVLAASVADVVEQYLGQDVADFLGEHNLKSSDITGWVCHPGGPKVLEAMERALDLRDGELDVTWRSLAQIGNLSSSSVLHVLADTLAGGAGARPPAVGTPGLLLAMGPGFCSELVLLEW
jgi:alkylresorcinol/alkylpyrone synthase